jgi:hypothetical protein
VLRRITQKVWRGLRWRLFDVVEEVTSRHRRELEDQAARHRRELEAVVRRETDRVIGLMNELETRSRRDILVAGEREAVADSARFARERMLAVPVFFDPCDTLGYALKLAPEDGMALEFGVYTGRTLTAIAAARNGREVYGFDSFQGLPEDWRSPHPAGTFRTDSPPEVEGADIVVGMFADTLPGFLADHPGPVAFLHLDADLYSSTRTVLEHVGPRLRPGSVVLFDEYFNYLGWEQHEHRAWQEFVERTGIRFRYEAYTANNEQVVARVTGL